MQNNSEVKRNENENICFNAFPITYDDLFRKDSCEFIKNTYIYFAVSYVFFLFAEQHF